jgi:hypothetical protein
MQTAPDATRMVPARAVPIEIVMQRCLFGFCFFPPSAGRFLTPLCATFRSAIDAVVGRSFGGLASFDWAFSHEQFFHIPRFPVRVL